MGYWGYDPEVWDLRRVACISVRPTLTCAQATLAETTVGRQQTWNTAAFDTN